MSADEDNELRDLIVQTLEKNGVVGRIKAELRASVFLALEEEGCLKDKIPIVNKKLAEFASTHEGLKVISLLREFMEFFNMDFTTSVFDPEVCCGSEFLSRESLCKEYGLSNCPKDSSVISEILQQRESVDISKLKKQEKTKEFLFESAKTVEPKVSLSPLKISSDELRPDTVSDFITSTQGYLFPLGTEEKSTNDKRDNVSDNSNSNIGTRDYFPLLQGMDTRNNNAEFNNTEASMSMFTTNKRKDDMLFSESKSTFEETYNSSKKSQKESTVISDSQVASNVAEIEEMESVCMDNIPNQDIYSQENSEPSIEEDIDISAGMEDLFSSISGSEDTTNDVTVSDISHIDPKIDHVENASP